MKRIIISHPFVFGVLVALLLFCAIIVVETWFPSIEEGLRKHSRLAQAALFTAIYFAVYIYGLRRWRRAAAFWLTILVLFLIHILGVFFYSAYVHPILVWQWPIVGLLEYYAAAFFLSWWTQRLGHANMAGDPRLGTDQESAGEHDLE